MLNENANNKMQQFHICEVGMTLPFNIHFSCKIAHQVVEAKHIFITQYHVEVQNNLFTPPQYPSLHKLGPK